MTIEEMEDFSRYIKHIYDASTQLIKATKLAESNKHISSESAEDVYFYNETKEFLLEQFRECQAILKEKSPVAYKEEKIVVILNRLKDREVF